jgi:hypothetical protein
MRNPFVPLSFVVGAVACAFAVTGTAADQQPTDKGPMAAPKLGARVELSGDWVVGVPLWAILTVTNLSDKTLGTLSSPTATKPFEVRGYTLVLTDVRSGQEVCSVAAPLNSGSGGGGLRPVAPSPLNLPAQGTVSVPFRICWPAEGPPPGEYTLALRNESKAGVAEFSAGARVKVREPTAEERPFIREAQSMWLYPFQKSAPAQPSPVPASVKEMLGMDLLLHELFTVEKPSDPYVPPPGVVPVYGDELNFLVKSQIRRLEAENLGADLPKFFGPVTRVLRYEIMVAQDRGAKASEIKESVVKTEPGYQWLFDRVGAKNGVEGLILRGRRSAF